MKQLGKNVSKWIVISMIGLLLGFLLGKFKQNILQDSISLLTADLNNLSVEKSALTKQLAHLDAQVITDKRMINQLTQENKKLNEQADVLSNKVYFYERVVSPELAPSGAKIYSFSVTENAETGQWDYELVLMQAQKGRRFLIGQVDLIFAVFENAHLKNVPLSSLSEEPPVNFKFKYFQTIKGSFTFPAQMTVDEVLLDVNVTGNRWHKPQQVEQRYDWQTLTAKDANQLLE